jgi:Chromate transporter
MAEKASGSWPEVLRAFLKLGLTSFGGPVAHLGYFRPEFVARRAWLAEPAYADLVALCQFLPGPASSQVGIGIDGGEYGHGGVFAVRDERLRHAPHRLRHHGDRHDFQPMQPATTGRAPRPGWSWCWWPSPGN